MKEIVKSINVLLKYGWNDRTIAKYLMIKEQLVRLYRKKLCMPYNKYQEFY